MSHHETWATHESSIAASAPTLVRLHERATTVTAAGVCRMKLLQVQFYLAELGRWIEHALIAVCGILLCVMASSVFFEVLIRYVIHAPTAWTEETAQFVLVWYGLLAAAVGARKGVHFAIRWGVIRFSDRTRWIIRQGVNVVVIIFLSALLKLGLDYLDIVANQTSTGAEINMRIPWAGIPAGIGSILAIYVLEVADAVLSIWTGRQFSVKEAREEDIYRALRGETVPPAPRGSVPVGTRRTESGAWPSQSVLPGWSSYASACRSRSCSAPRPWSGSCSPRTGSTSCRRWWSRCSSRSAPSIFSPSRSSSSPAASWPKAASRRFSWTWPPSRSVADAAGWARRSSCRRWSSTGFRALPRPTRRPSAR